jgi:hypothetical protein
MKLVSEGECGRLGCYGRGKEVEFRGYSFENASQRGFSQDFCRFHKELYEAGYTYTTHASVWHRHDSEEDDEPMWTDYFIYPLRGKRDSVGEICYHGDVRVCTIQAYYKEDPRLDSFLRSFSPKDK